MPGRRMLPARGAAPLPRPRSYLRVPGRAPVQRQEWDPARQRAPPGPGRPLWDAAGGSPRPGAVARAGRERNEGTGGEGALGCSSRPGRPGTERGASPLRSSVLAPGTSLECPRGTRAAALIILFPTGNGKSGVKPTSDCLGKGFGQKHERGYVYTLIFLVKPKE